MPYVRTIVTTAVATVFAFGAGMVGFELSLPARERLALIDKIESTLTELTDESVGKSLKTGDFVHVRGTPKVAGVLRDEDTGFTADMLVLKRRSRILQWVETAHRQGKAPTTYSYKMEWPEHIVDSTAFHNNGDSYYFNGGRILSPTEVFLAPLEIAGMRMSARFMEEVKDWTRIDLDQKDYAAMPALFRDRFEVRNGDLYSKGNVMNGTVWTAYEGKRAKPMSLVGVVHGDRIDPIDLGDGMWAARVGDYSAAELMANAREAAEDTAAYWHLGAGAAGALGFAFAAAAFVDERKSRPKPRPPAIIWGRG